MCRFLQSALESKLKLLHILMLDGSDCTLVDSIGEETDISHLFYG